LRLLRISIQASSPPKYPRNPTEAKRSPLTLYIARVPGSKDVILTTLKPQLKNVTAEDVASSLYYLHLVIEEDAALLRRDSSPVFEEPEVPVSLQQSLPRKPLLETTGSSFDTESSASQITGSQLSLPSTIPRKPVVDVKYQDKQVSISNDQVLPRRPLGPRSLVKGHTGLDRKPLPGSENAPLQSTPQDRSKYNTVQPSLDPHSISGESRSSSPKDISIVLIRRDPSSGAQWNIGTVTGQPMPGHVRIGRETTMPRMKKPYFNMSIQISSPGYSSFRVPREIRDYRETGSTPSQPSSAATFDREVRMEGSSFWNRSSIQHRRTDSDLPSVQNQAHGRSSCNNVDVPRSKPFEDMQDGKSSDSKGYMFVSPWGGRCKFSTGSGGRSLLCQHTLPDPLAIREVQEVSDSRKSAVVSELRFNLPSVSLFGSSKSHGTKEKGGVDSKHFHLPSIGYIREKLSAHEPQLQVSRPHPTSYAAMYPSDEEIPPALPPQSSSVTAARGGHQGRLPYEGSKISMKDEPIDYEEENRLNLSIGQEKAGGGNRGKRAKLGKLIIHDEGLKMLDLVVAANMGIWWSIWEPDQL